MKKCIDLSNKKFGRLLVVRRVESNGSRKRTVFLCICDCGKTLIVRSDDLRNGHSSSCGCFKNELTITRSTVHGMHKHLLYSTWNAMVQRCNNPKATGFIYYGGRGIAVCERWNNFENFLADMVPRPTPSHSLDRYPRNNGNYEPGNCRWATKIQQANNKRNNHIIEFKNQRNTLTQWSVILGISQQRLFYQIKHWPMEKVFASII